MRQVVTAGSYKPWYRYGAFEELFDSAARDGIILSDELITQTFGSIHEQLQEIWGQIRSLRTNRAPHLYTADNVA